MLTIVFGLVAPRAREKLYMHALYVSALRPWVYADTSTSHKLGSEAHLYLQCSREDISTLLNAIAGNCLIRSRALRLGLSYHDFCRSCKQIDEEESIEHLLCFCPAHNLKRFQTLDSYTLPNLAAIQGVSIQKLLCFLRRTKYFAK